MMENKSDLIMCIDLIETVFDNVVFCFAVYR